jgi:hypothetical protein
MHSLTTDERFGPLGTARVLIALQAAVLITATVEALILGTILGGAQPATLGLTGGSAALALAAAWGLGRRARWARRLTIVGESFVLLTAAVDAILAIALIHGLPPLVTVVTGGLVPLAVLALLRRTSRP